jgi:5-methylcytosine-specific restriction endonuclease McrA
MISKAKRGYIYSRDGHVCVKCGSSKRVTLDHFIPQSAGGGDSKFNLWTLCFNCNNAKGDTLPSDAEKRAFKSYLEKVSVKVEVKVSGFDWGSYNKSLIDRAKSIQFSN